MIEISITPTDLNLLELMVGLEKIGDRIFPKTAKAFKTAAMLVQYTWKSYSLGAPIPGSKFRVKNSTGAYARSIKIIRLSPFSYEVSTDNPIAIYIEKGTKEYDMKKTHPYGKRSRVDKNGNPYLIIPMRHGVPGTQSYGPMPQQVYDRISQLLKTGEVQKSEVVEGKAQTKNYWDELINRARYSWGTRIKGTGDKNLEGLVVMNVSTGGGRRSEYLTFRVISVNSPAHKWIQPAREGSDMTQHVVNNSAPIIQQLIEKAILEDITA